MDITRVMVEKQDAPIDIESTTTRSGTNEPAFQAGLTRDHLYPILQLDLYCPE